MKSGRFWRNILGGGGRGITTMLEIIIICLLIYREPAVEILKGNFDVDSYSFLCDFTTGYRDR